MGVIPNITSQVNLVRNGDFKHYVNLATSPSPAATVWDALVAHWRLDISPSVASTVTEEATVLEGEPRRYLGLQVAENLTQRIVSTDVYERPSVRELGCTISALPGGDRIEVTAPSDYFIVSEPSPAPLAAVSRSMQVGDQVQIANFTNPDGSGVYRIASVTSATVAQLDPVTAPDPSVNTVADSLNVLRKLDINKIELTLVYSVPAAQADTAIDPTIIVSREAPMADVTVSPLVIAGGVDFDVVALPGGTAKQLIHRFVVELPRLPRYIELNLENVAGIASSVADVGLFIGNYHMPVTTTFPVPAGTLQEPLVTPPDHLHLLTGRGDLILMRAGSQAPEGYKKLREELAFQEATVIITYDAVSDRSAFTITDWRLPPNTVSGTFEIVFTDAPLAPANPGPLDVSVRMTDVTFVDARFGGAQIDLAALGGGETVTLGVPPAATTVVLTEGVDFTTAATLADAINADLVLSPYLLAIAVGTVVQVRTLMAGWTDAQLLAEGYTLADTVTGADWEEIGGGGGPLAQLVIPTSGIISASFSARGDHSARTGTTALIVATAPVLSNSPAFAGILRKPTKTGEGAVRLASDQIEIDTAGVELNDILTFVTEDGTPLAAVAGQGPSYQITSVNIEENEVVLVDITGGTTDITSYTADAENFFVIEKSSDRHTHYAGKADIDERDLESGGSNNNTGRGNHGHEFFPDDAIPPFRKFIICEKL